MDIEVAQTPKKRAASSQDGPPAKKANIQHPTTVASRQKFSAKTARDIRKPSDRTKVNQDRENRDFKGRKRVVPVTRAHEEDGLDTEEESADALGNESDEDAESAGDDGMDIDDQTKSVRVKDPNANHASHAAQRELLASRRAAKPRAALLAEAKRIWAQARQKDRERRSEGTCNGGGTDKAERRAYVQQLMDLLRGHVQELVLKHDASRIIQTIVKYGTPAQRLEVAKELHGHYLQLVQRKYSKFLVSKLIKYSPPARTLILPELVPEIPRLLHHAYASPVLADAYELYCTGSERTQLLRAFWGREAALFGDGTFNGEAKGTKKNKAVEALIAARSKESEINTAQLPSGNGLKDVLNASNDIERRKRALAAVRENLLSVFNNPSPIAIRHAITHRALWEYLEAVGSTVLFPPNAFPYQARERAWREVYESCQEQLAEMVHTREGSRSVREFIARGTAKDRKQIVKVLKPHLARIAQHDEAQLVLFTALDVIDDTKLTAKQLVDELLPDPPTFALPTDLLASTAGRRALIYLLLPRTPRHFPPALVTTLAATDSLRMTTSKKDPSVRVDEVRRAASPALLALVADRGVALSRDPKGSLVVAEIMLFAEGDKSASQEKLIEALAKPYPSADESDPHAIDIPHTSRLYKTLLQGGHYDRTTGALTRAQTFDAGAFATAFARVTGRTNIISMARGNGAFVIAELCARLCVEGDMSVRNDMHAWFDEDVRAEIGRSSVKGRDVLLEKLKQLDAAK